MGVGKMVKVRELVNMHLMSAGGDNTAVFLKFLKFKNYINFHVS